MLRCLVVLALSSAGWAAAQEAASGQGDYRFRVLHTRTLLPPEAQAVLERAHGGFAIDRRPGKGEVYFALPGAGIVRIAADLGSAAMLPTPDEIKNNNMHNTCIWYDGAGEAYLSFPADGLGKIFTTRLDGTLVHTLEAPKGETTFDEAAVDAYFGKGGKFVPTDLDDHNGLMYIATGYSDLDYVLTARINGNGSIAMEWNDLAFGGRGEGPAKFGTGHGVTVSPDGARINVADRPQSEVERFTRYGHYRDTLELPEGAWPCDVDFEAGYTAVGCLHGPDRSKGAPVYLLQGDTVVSTVMPQAELGLEKFTHIHNAVVTRRNGTLYLIAQAWNPGDFVILEQLKP